MIFEIPALLDESQTAAARAFAEQSEFVSGKATNRQSSVKNNEQVAQSKDESSEVGNMIVRALFDNEVVAQTAFPKAIPAPTFSRYRPDMYYGPHVDDAIMNTDPKPLRTDASVTVFLSSHDEYDGGELELHIGSTSTLIKMNAGDAVVYPTGIIHQVRRVTRGTRYAAITWIESFIPEFQQRRVLSHLHQLMERIGGKMDEADLLLMQSVRTSLYRMWMEL